jgi:hypothetical protein
VNRGWELEAAAAGWHSQEFVIMFLGYLTSQIPELRKTHPGSLLRSWAEFQTEMSKERTDVQAPQEDQVG